MPLNMLKISKGSRRKPKRGDIFAFQMGPDKLFRFGRVIRTDARIGLDDGKTILVYIYRQASSDMLQLPPLHRDQLLLPPLGINASGWREGYFETVENRPLQPDDMLPVHCFYDPSRRRYVDADRRPLPKAHELCGLDAIGGYGSVDLKVSQALGFPEPTEDAPAPVANLPIGGPSKEKCKRRDVEHAVTILIAGVGIGPLSSDFEQFEDRLADAVSEAHVGEWDGHQFALDGSHTLVHLYGKDADRLVEVVLPIVQAAKLPKGSFILKRYGGPGDAEERIEL